MARVLVAERAPARSNGLAAFWRKWGIYYLMMAPYLIIFGVFTVLPVVASGGLSLTYYNLLEPPRFIGRSVFYWPTMRTPVQATGTTGPLTGMYRRRWRGLGVWRGRVRDLVRPGSRRRRSRVSVGGAHG